MALPPKTTHLSLAVALTLALGGCGSDSEITSSFSSETSTHNTPITIALDPTANATDPEAFKVWAYSANGMKDGTVKFCFGDVAGCQAGTNVTIPGVRKQVGSISAFVSEKYVRLSSNLMIVVMAENSAGQAMLQKGQIQTPGAVPPQTTPQTPQTPQSPQTPAQPQGSECYNAPDAFTCQVEVAVWRMTNEKRQSVGKGPLSFAPKIGCASRLWSVEQARRGNISHDWFSNGTLRQKYRNECQGTGSLNAENVAMSGGSQNDPEAIARQFVNMWWNSPGHKANMLGNYKSLGVGFAKSSRSWYGTQNFGSE